jgi:hypothetical protein
VYDNGWSAWQSLAGGIARPGTGAAAVELSKDRVDVFVVGLNGHLWQYVAFDDGNAGWQGRGTWYDHDSLTPPHVGRPNSTLSAANRAGGSVELVALDGYNQVQHTWFENIFWSDFYTSGGVTSGTAYGPAVTSLASDKVEVFVRGLDGRLWWQTWGPH